MAQKKQLPELKSTHKTKLDFGTSSLTLCLPLCGEMKNSSNSYKSNSLLYKGFSLLGLHVSIFQLKPCTHPVIHQDNQLEGIKGLRNGVMVCGASCLAYIHPKQCYRWVYRSFMTNTHSASTSKTSDSSCTIIDLQNTQLEKIRGKKNQQIHRIIPRLASSGYKTDSQGDLEGVCRHPVSQLNFDILQLSDLKFVIKFNAKRRG